MQNLSMKRPNVPVICKKLERKKLNSVLIVGHGANLTASIRTLLGYETGELRKMVDLTMLA